MEQVAKTSAWRRWNERSNAGGPSRILGLACFVAVASPFLFGYGTLPLTNFAAEIVSMVGFALLLVMATQYGALGSPWGNLKIAGAAVAVMLVTVLIQYWYFGSTNLMAWVVLAGYFVLALLAAWVGHAAHAGAYKLLWLRSMAIGLLLGGVLASIASIAQYFQWDGSWAVLSPSATPGRTFGFIRQPNHQATYLCLGMAALFALQALVGRRAGTMLMLFLAPLLAFGAVSTGSRTALVQLVCLSVGGFFFLRRQGRNGFITALYPLAWTVIVWGALYLLSQHAGIGFHGASKLTQTATEGVGVRALAWRETLELIYMRPWFGWGLPHYGSAFFTMGAAERIGLPMTHSHNILLQLAFGVGIPVTVAVVALVCLVLWRARGQAGQVGGFFAFAVIGLLLIHSQVEFPLWYTYFLLPACFCLGWLSHGAADPTEIRGAGNPRWRRVLAAALGAGTVGLAVWINHDYYRLTPVFSPGLEADFKERLDVARRVTWFRQYSEFLLLARTPVNEASHGHYLAGATELGCAMYEPWYQTNTIVALTYQGRIEEAKWLLYLYWRLSGGKMDQFIEALKGSKAPRAPEVLEYISRPVPVAANTDSFHATCLGRTDTHAAPNAP